MTATPIAYVIRRMPNPTHPGAYLLLVRCPVCGKTHTHGAPGEDAGPDYGHRSAHCLGGSRTAPRGYYVREHPREFGVYGGLTPTERHQPTRRATSKESPK